MKKILIMFCIIGMLGSAVPVNADQGFASPTGNSSGQSPVVGNIHHKRGWGNAAIGVLAITTIAAAGAAAITYYGAKRLCKYGT